MQVQQIQLEKIELLDFQAREDGTDPAHVEELVIAMKTDGFDPTSPLDIYPNEEKEGFYYVKNGAHRTKAAKKVGFESVPCFVVEKPASIAQLFLEQAVDNQVLNMKPMEIVNIAAQALEEGIPLGRIAGKLGKSPAVLKADLPLAKLPPEIKKAVNSGQCPKEVARKLADLDDGHIMKAFQLAMEVRTASAMLGRIEAYMSQVNQINMFAQAKEAAAENGGLGKARKTFEQMKRLAENYAENYLRGNNRLNIINANKRNLEEVKLVAKYLVEIGTTLKEDAVKMESQKAINAPKMQAVVNQ